MRTNEKFIEVHYEFGKGSCDQQWYCRMEQLCFELKQGCVLRGKLDDGRQEARSGKGRQRGQCSVETNCPHNFVLIYYNAQQATVNEHEQTLNSRWTCPRTHIFVPSRPPITVSFLNVFCLLKISAHSGCTHRYFVHFSRLPSIT